MLLKVTLLMRADNEIGQMDRPFQREMIYDNIIKQIINAHHNDWMLILESEDAWDNIKDIAIDIHKEWINAVSHAQWDFEVIHEEPNP